MRKGGTAEGPWARLRVEARGLVCGRGQAAVAGPVDVALDAGGALAVLGPNGAGKSTLLRTLAGLLPPLAGSVQVEGVLAPDGEPAVRLREAAHYLGHRNALKAGLAVAADLGFWQRFRGVPGLSPEAALESVGLGGLGPIPAGRLSAGQGRRAALARLLVARRPVWILDEPTASLDRLSERRVAELLAAHRGEGGIVVAATHLPLGLEGARELRLAPASAPVPLAAGTAAGLAPADEAALARAEGWL